MCLCKQNIYGMTEVQEMKSPAGGLGRGAPAYPHQKGEINMRIQYGLFDSAAGDDRVYVADRLADVFRALALSGVVDGDSLKITAAGSGMKVNMAAGSALVNGYIMTAVDDGGGVYSLTLNAGSSYARIDRVILRLDLSTDARTVTPMILQGTPAASPTVPALARSGDTWDLSLAQLYVAAGATQIVAANITDERMNESVCGLLVPAALRLSTLGKTHAHDAVTATTNGFMTAAQAAQLTTNTNNITAQGTQIAANSSGITALQGRVAPLETDNTANKTQLAGLTSASTPTFKGANLTGTLNMNGNYIDGALFR